MSRNGTEVADSIHRLTNGVSNFYLVEENGKLVLVDAGAPKDWARLTRAVTALGRKVADLDAVILTHAHSDHTGFAEQARTTAGARVWVPAPDSDMATTGKVGPRDGKYTAYLLRPAFYRTLWILTLGGATKIIPVESRRVLLTGDALVTHNPLTGRVGPQIMPSGLNSDSAQALRSLDNLADMTADVLLAGHGEPWTDGVAAAVGRAKAAGTS